MKYLTSVVFLPFCLAIFSCNNINTEASQKTNKYLFHPKKQDVNLEGSVLFVDNGVMVLVQNGPLKTIPTILFAANDSAKSVIIDAYTLRMTSSYKTTGTVYVKLAGNFVREDSLSPIFKFNWVELMDKSSELKQIEEMEE